MARNKPGKPRRPRKRSRELHERSRTTGVQYTAVMRENDSIRAGGNTTAVPPSGVARSPYAYGGDGRETVSIPVMLTATVSRKANADEVAQAVADACAYLVRQGEGWYRAMAYVWALPTRIPAPQQPERDLLTMLVVVAAARPWTTADGQTDEAEPVEVVTDVLNAVTAALARAFPDADAEPGVLPLGGDKATEILQTAGGLQAALVTSDVHPSLLTEGADDAEPEREEEPSAAEPPAYRYVDRLNRGWHIASTEPVRYAVDWAGLRPDRPSDLLTHAELAAAHGPLRPVGPGDPSDDLVLRGALADAGVKAAGSVLVALYRLTLEYKRGSSPGGYEGGSLVAGREGSWQSEAINRLAWTIGGDLDEKPKRYSEECVTSVIAVLRAWTQHPKRYVEVAEKLAYEFSKVADELGGWSKVADRPFQPATAVGRHPAGTIEAVYYYLMSQSSEPVLERDDFM
ncbi:hypothetical protein [Streptomyces melanogenes]|uniref:hypothetical protein n=1 Tax=Streptomyces melanogenes TaxID=67326 RepID=UPI00167C77AF|nr:hypothetical protein [Streptomyces melanogenes]GGP78515.1 hypothetical protein GCM10010278_66220 [Streptomyces melanogenes]